MLPIKYLSLSLIAIGGLFGITPEATQAGNDVLQEATTTVQQQIISTSTARAIVERVAIENKVSPKLALHIVDRESRFLATARGDQEILANGYGGCSNKKSPLYGRPANARGLWQITECYWPEVTDAQADDPEWSSRWAMERLKDGQCNLWSTCPLD